VRPEQQLIILNKDVTTKSKCLCSNDALTFECDMSGHRTVIFSFTSVSLELHYVGEVHAEFWW
jgi:hypothetical protein